MNYTATFAFVTPDKKFILGHKDGANSVVEFPVADISKTAQNLSLKSKSEVEMSLKENVINYLHNDFSSRAMLEKVFEVFTMPGTNAETINFIVIALLSTNTDFGLLFDNNVDIEYLSPDMDKIDYCFLQAHNIDDDVLFSDLVTEQTRSYIYEIIIPSLRRHNIIM